MSTINLHFYTIMTCNEIFNLEHPDGSKSD